MKEWFAEEKAQASLEYLYLTAFAIGIAAITAVLLKNLLDVQQSIREKLSRYRDQMLGKLVR